MEVIVTPEERVTLRLVNHPLDDGQDKFLQEQIPSSYSQNHVHEDVQDGHTFKCWCTPENSQVCGYSQTFSGRFPP